jgi:zinc D-Ala-D-Ala dipeptidase
MSLDHTAVRNTPVPSSAEALVRKRGYRKEVAIAFDGALAGEGCIEAQSVGLAGANHYNSQLNPPYYGSIPGSIPDLYLRRSVATKLVQINENLAPLGIEVFLFDAWRPQAIQRYFHDIWFPNWLRARQPHLAGEALVAEVEKYWAEPSAGKTSPSPHSTGAAVDLTLIFRDTRQLLYMGGIFDDLTEAAWTDGFERKAMVSMSDEEARANRRLLYWAMTKAGFANNPTEWWHYSWGDQLWARLTSQPRAHYGGCNPTSRPDS